MPSSYRHEQLESLEVAMKGMAEMPSRKREEMQDLIRDYLSFRSTVDAFLHAHVSGICSPKCYENQLSACCSKDGVVIFFADTVINALTSSASEMEAFQSILEKQRNMDFKCIYLTQDGCAWKIKPIVCEMFLCDNAWKEALSKDEELLGRWKELERKRMEFTWPDKPVLFDKLEAFFIEEGLRSVTMYYHNSPGLLNVKKKAGLINSIKKEEAGNKIQ